MGWEALIPLIVQYGLPLAERIWQKWANKEPVSQADWDELKAMAAETPESLAKKVIAAKGLSLDDPKVIELLELLKPKT